MAKVTIDDLARMIQKEFANQNEKFGKEFESVKKEISDLKLGYETLKQGQDDIKLRLDHVAHKFEVKDLEKRVDILETDVKTLKMA